MNKCPICEAANPENAQACSSCGSPLDASAHVFSLQPGTRLHKGRFTIGKKIGQGGFGITYLGSDLNDKQTVAIKEFFLSGCARDKATVIPTSSITQHNFEEIRDKFLDEGMMLSKFHHPGVVGVKSVFSDNNTAYIAMEYLKGETLLEILERRSVLPEDEAVSIIKNIAEALVHVHKEGVLHRDIKPDNIMITGDGRVVLIDFGSARGFAANRTRSMTSWLTPGYAPFEQYSRKAHFTETVDIYALGATLYHCLTGQQPEQASDRMIKDELVPACVQNPKVSKKTSDLILWAMQLKPEDRPQSAGEFLKALDGAISTPVHAPGNNKTILIQQDAEVLPKVSVDRSSGSPRPAVRRYLPIFMILLGILILALVLYPKPGIRENGEGSKGPIHENGEVSSSPINENTKDNKVEIFLSAIKGPASMEEGSSAAFSVEASGDTGYAYQWSVSTPAAAEFDPPSGSKPTLKLRDIKGGQKLTIYVSVTGSKLQSAARRELVISVTPKPAAPAPKPKKPKTNKPPKPIYRPG